MIPARILIIDPHPATREGVRQFLAADPARWEVCGCESNAQQAIAQLAHLQPDLAIVEYEGHGMDGLELAAQLGRLRRALEVMLYTANTFPSALQRIVPAEVAGAVLKTEPLDELALGLETIRRRHRFRSGEITRLCKQAEEELQSTAPLSPTELEILQLTADGKAAKEIAEHRGVSPKTIETQQRSIRRKLRVPLRLRRGRPGPAPRTHPMRASRDSGERGRLARWRWRPRHREFSRDRRIFDQQPRADNQEPGGEASPPFIRPFPVPILSTFAFLLFPARRTHPIGLRPFTHPGEKLRPCRRRVGVPKETQQ